jgi:hypothetical protein
MQGITHNQNPKSGVEFRVDDPKTELNQVFPSGAGKIRSRGSQIPGKSGSFLSGWVNK